MNGASFNDRIALSNNDAVRRKGRRPALLSCPINFDLANCAAILFSFIEFSRSFVEDTPAYFSVKVVQPSVGSPV